MPRSTDLLYRVPAPKSPYNPAALSAVLRYAGQSGAPAVFLATAMVESNLNPRATGDSGNSFGIFQLNRNGRLATAGLTPQQAFDPDVNARVSADEFRTFYDRGYRGAKLALAAQRPSDPAYARKINAALPIAKRLLAEHGASAPSGANPSPGQGAAPGSGGGELTPASLKALRKYVARTEKQVLSGQAPEDPFDLMADLRYTAVQTAVGDVGLPADPSKSQAVNAAEEHLGVPYSWGGGTTSGPSRGFGRGAGTVGFDCSSLVQYAWAKAGVKLPRTTYDQIKVGQGINAKNRAAWKPGDLMFPHTGHVQMYVGGGKVIEAPRTGGKVHIVPARSSYIAVRRPA